MLTQDQILQAKATATPGGVSSPTQGMTPEQAQAWIGSSASQNTVQPSPQTPAPNLGQLDANQLTQAGNKIVSSVKNAGTKLASDSNGSVGGLVKGVGDVGEGLLGAGAGIVQGVFAPVTATIQKLMQTTGGDKLIQKIATSEHVKPTIDAINTWAKAHPEAATNLQDALTVGTAVAGGEAGLLGKTASEMSVGDLGNTLKGAATDATGAAKDTLEAAKSSLTATPEATAAKTSQQIQSVASDWEKPTVQPGNTFSKAKAALSKDPTIPQFLAEQKLAPSAHIENGKYATEDSADALRDTAGKMSSDALRPSLQMADYSTPKTPITEIKVPDKLIQAQGKGVTADDVEAIQAKIQTKLAALQRKYPNGMSLTDLHDEKITYAQNGKFSPVGDASVDNNAIANRSLSSVLGGIVEKKAPAEIPVADFNDYLAKYYKAADYLDTLQGRKAPMSTLQYIAHKSAQVVGAGVGHAVGGGVLGGVGGYMIGGALEHAFENLTLPMRDAFIRNLEITHPEAVGKIKEYLAQQASGNTGMLRLPAPTSDTPIPLKGDSTPQVIAPYAARGPVGINPKGQFTKTYTSMPK